VSTLWRIRDRSTFVELRRRGRRLRSGYLTLTWVARPSGEPPQVAYAIGRGVGSAVVRNRVRRRLRWALGQLDGKLPPGAYLLGVSPAAATATAHGLLRDLQSVVAALPEPVEAAPPEGRR
jgi:ribonuclease P protein component